MSLRTRNMTSIYLFRDGNVLLLYRQGSRVANNVWMGSAGGHFEEQELNDPEACVLRELHEELGLERNDIEGLCLRYTTLKREKDEVRQNYFFFAELKRTVSTDLNSTEGISRWFPVDEIGNLEMPYSAKYVVEHYIETGKFTSQVYVGIADGCEVKFLAIPEYQ